MNSNKIIDYYKITLVNYEKNMLKQSKEHLKQNQKKYIQSYEGILRRMNEKIMQNFVYLLSNNIGKSEG